MAAKLPSTSDPGAGSAAGVEIEKLGPQQHVETPVGCVGLSIIPSMLENKPSPKKMLALWPAQFRMLVTRCLC